MNPYILNKLANTCIMSNRASRELKKLILDLGIEIIETIDNKAVTKEISDHPDVSIHLLDEATMVVAREVYDYYKEKLKGLNIIAAKEDLEAKYPGDSKLNVGRLGNYYIHFQGTDENIENYYKANTIEKIKVKQGYSKCSTININYDTIVTSDMGIHKKVISKGCRSHLLPPGGIRLEGYDTGFIGGCGGFAGGNKLIMSGDLKLCKYGIVFEEIIKLYKIDLLYPKNCEMTDIGSLIFVNRR